MNQYIKNVVKLNIELLDLSRYLFTENYGYGYCCTLDILTKPEDNRQKSVAKPKAVTCTYITDWSENLQTGNNNNNNNTDNF